MASKLLLCVSAEQATIAKWRGRRLSECRRFDNSHDGRTAFATCLGANRGLPLHVMVDTVDEDYRFETLPHVRGGDRAEMVGRKLRQLYRSTPYSSALLQERDPGKRRDDRYLFAALTNPDLIAPWLQLIAFNGLAVAGVYPLPLVGISLIDRLKLKHPNLLIVTKNSAGFRQTFFKNLRFRLSRLTPLRDAVDMANQYYAEEISNTRMYLDALTVTHVDDTLTVLVLDQDDSLDDLTQTITSGRPNIRCQRLARADLTTVLGMDQSVLDASPDALYLQLLGERVPTLNLAPRTTTGGYRGYQAKRVVHGASITIAAGAILWGGFNVYSAMQMEESIADLARQTVELQARYQQVTAQFPQAPASAAGMRDAVEVSNQIRASLRTPETMFGVVSKALDASPEVYLNRLEWRSAAASPDAAPATGTPFPVTADSGKPGTQVGIIFGEVRPFAGDFRSALATINAFASRLAESGTVAEVRALQLPLNVDPDAGLTGSTTASATQGKAAFQLAVIFKPGT